MAALWILGILLALILLLLLLRVGVHIRFGDALCVTAMAGPVRLQLVPKPEKKKPEKPKKQGSMPKLTLSDILALADLACDTLGNLRRKLRVEVLVLHVTLDGSDPAKAAMLYGRVWAALGALTPKLEQLFVIKKRDIQPILDYNEKEMKLDAQLVLTITIGRAICLAMRALVRFLKLWLNKKKAVSNT